MSDWIEIIVLGVVQGVAEFLPISSDGHLVVVNALFEHFSGRHRTDVLERTVALHAGTLLAVLVVYGREFLHALMADSRTLALLVVGTLPAIGFGLAADQFFKKWLEDPVLAGWGLIGTGIVLLLGRRPTVGTLRYQDLNFAQALEIGVLQATAILPGISRSGTTITGGLWAGLQRPDAATFSFLLSIPAVGGACALESAKLAAGGPGAVATPVAELAVGAGVSFFVGLAALLWLLKMLRAGRFHLFAYWCIPLGLAVLAWQFLGS